MIELRNRKTGASIMLQVDNDDDCGLLIDGVEMKAQERAEKNPAPDRIMPYSEWLDSKDADDLMRIMTGKAFSSMGDLTGLGKPLALLIWARYVARQLNVRKSDFAPGFTVTGFYEGGIWRSTAPFEFQESTYQEIASGKVKASTNNTRKFYEVVGEDNLAEIRKLFY